MTHNTTMRRHGSIEPKGRGVVLPAYAFEVRSGRTLFPTRVFDPDEVGRVLKTGHQSRKIGATVAKGARRGWPIFTLTLEERATCPRSCTEWQHCFGNNMQAAERITPGPALEAALAAELADLQRLHPHGFMVRLHVLGDFYSAGYVEAWRQYLTDFPALHVFGFTARLPGTEIGDLLWQMAGDDWPRFAVRFSGLPGPVMASQIKPDDDPQSIDCPAQTGAADCCATCMLCIHSARSIAFRRH